MYRSGSCTASSLPLMPPLQRVETPRSQASWWSDRNPMLHISPTMNIHAAAKPLMKFLYHRQALGIMEDNRDSPLPEELLDIYSAYLSYQYVSPATRIVVLQHLERRAHSSADDARAILCSSVLNPMLQLLTIERFRTTTYPLVGLMLAYALGFWQNSDFVGEVTTLLQTNSKDVLIATTAALTAFSEQPDSTTPVMVALLHSHDKNAQRWACTLIEELARRDLGLSPTLLELPSFKKLVNLLRDSSDELVIEAALAALTAVSQQPDGAATIVSTDALQHLHELLKSTSGEIRYKACVLVSSLAHHSEIANILPMISIAPLLNLFLNDEQPRIRTPALSVLAEMAVHPAGAAAVIEAKTLDHLTELLSPGFEDTGCLLLANLRKHNKSRKQSNLVEMLFELSSGEDEHVATQAISELIKISARPDETSGTSRTIVGNVLARLSVWFESPRAAVRRQACTMMGVLAGYEFAVPAIIRAKKIETLSNLLRDQDPSVASAAICAINRITEHVHPKILTAIITAKTLNHGLELLGTNGPDGGFGASVLLENLRKQKSGVKRMLRANLVEMLFELFRRILDPYVAAQAVSELMQIAEHPDGRASSSAILARILEGLASRLESPQAIIRRQGCDLFVQLARHEVAVSAILKTNLIQTLSNLLRRVPLTLPSCSEYAHARDIISDEDLELVNGAMHALTRISEYPDGAAAVIAAHAVDYLPQLNVAVSSKAYILLTTLRKHEPALPLTVWTNVMEKLAASYAGYLGWITV
ncbi:armadillo-type protein [Roridomyces roridus]|uniref:Vacuolar protein 8 n=1 Tax=Roridomyces roridus TaxID=1738132 RepID=A0AAD7BIX1_9AGAR|nr:armadillo-type protein [Roridomyces roridus]